MVNGISLPPLCLIGYHLHIDNGGSRFYFWSWYSAFLFIECFEITTFFFSFLFVFILFSWHIAQAKILGRILDKRWRLVGDSVWGWVAGEVFQRTSVSRRCRKKCHTQSTAQEGTASLRFRVRTVRSIWQAVGSYQTAECQTILNIFSPPAIQALVRSPSSGDQILAFWCVSLPLIWTEAMQGDTEFWDIRVCPWMMVCRPQFPIQTSAGFLTGDSDLVDSKREVLMWAEHCRVDWAVPLMLGGHSSNWWWAQPYLGVHRASLTSSETRSTLEAEEADPK